MLPDPFDDRGRHPLGVDVDQGQRWLSRPVGDVLGRAGYEPGRRRPVQCRQFDLRRNVNRVRQVRAESAERDSLVWIKPTDQDSKLVDAAQSDAFGLPSPHDAGRAVADQRTRVGEADAFGERAGGASDRGQFDQCRVSRLWIGCGFPSRGTTTSVGVPASAAAHVWTCTVLVSTSSKRPVASAPATALA